MRGEKINLYFFINKKYKDHFKINKFSPNLNTPLRKKTFVDLPPLVKSSAHIHGEKQSFRLCQITPPCLLYIYNDLWQIKRLGRHLLNGARYPSNVRVPRRYIVIFIPLRLVKSAIISIASVWKSALTAVVSPFLPSSLPLFYSLGHKIPLLFYDWGLIVPFPRYPRVLILWIREKIKIK